MNHYGRFFTSLVIAAAFLTALFFVANELLHLGIPIIVLAVIFVFALLTAVLYRYVIGTTNKSPARFVTAALGTVTTKLLLSAAFFGVYVYLSDQGRVQVGLSLFVVYMTFTTMMTIHISRYVRHLQEKMKSEAATGK